MPIELVALIIFSVAQIGTPGPANMALLATGASFGFRRALPFVVGVVVGKQLIIWPLGFGLMQLAESWPALFLVMKYLSAVYIIYLAWHVANMRLKFSQGEGSAPGFWAGLIVHPLEPQGLGYDYYFCAKRFCIPCGLGQGNLLHLPFKGQLRNVAYSLP
jgi:threonine/homoserine/homoserine lactone efflux protein